MRLFLREQLPFIGLYILHIHVLFLILWLDGYNHVLVYLYAVLISSFLLLVYLLFRYFTMVSFYRRLSTSIEVLNQSIDDLGTAPLSEALQMTLSSQYQKYQEGIMEMEDKMNRYNTFMNQWVHQMKTPLSVLYLLLQSKDNLDRDTIRSELDRIKHTLELVLYLGRLENIDRDLHIEPVNLQEIVERVLIDNKQLFIQSKLTPKISIHKGLMVESDEKWLAFILSQVIVNAIQYSRGTGKRVDLTGYLHGKKAILEVTDYGMGIPKQDLRRVFDLYFTGEKGANYKESTGLGLYLVKQVCDYLHHAVEIESEEGSKTTVRFSFSTGMIR